jgi:hypothetical protein
MEVTQRQSYCIWAVTTGYTRHTERGTQNTADVAQAAGDAQEVTAFAAIGLGLRGTRERENHFTRMAQLVTWPRRVFGEPSEPTVADDWTDGARSGWRMAEQIPHFRTEGASAN